MRYSAKNRYEQKFGLIDDVDTDLVFNRNINLNSEGYARVGSYKLHRIVLQRKIGRPIKNGFVVDHINRDRLDNRRENLREVSLLENNLNKSRPNRQCFGSTFLKKRNKWQAQIKINGHQKYLGVFATEHEAQQCYLMAAKELNRI